MIDAIKASNWKTTAAGVAAILGGLASLITALSNGDTSTIPHDYGVIMVGIGLVLAKDSGK